MKNTKFNEISVVALVIFFLVLILHPLIAHNHPSELFTAELPSSLHTTIAERIDVIPFIFFLAIIVRRAEYMSSIQHALLRGIQQVNIPTLLPLHNAFARGLLHTRAY